jgi:hypothetical protein
VAANERRERRERRGAMTWRFLLAVSLLQTTAPLPAQAPSPTALFVTDVQRTLAIGSLAERETILKRVAESGLTAKSPQIAAAVAHELERVSALVDKRGEARWAGRPMPNASEDYSEYYPLLVRACAQSDDPVVIDGLIGAISTGRLAADALARFGVKALGRVGAVAATDRHPLRAGGALITLQLITETHELSPEHLRQIAGWTRQRMQGRQPALLWGIAARLALITGDPELVRRVNAIADGSELPAVDRESDRSFIQSLVRDAIAKAREQKKR